MVGFVGKHKETIKFAQKYYDNYFHHTPESFCVRTSLNIEGFTMENLYFIDN